MIYRLVGKDKLAKGKNYVSPFGKGGLILLCHLAKEPSYREDSGI